MKKQRGSPSARYKGAQSNRLKAINHPSNKQALTIANDLRTKGYTLQEITDELNKRRLKTPKDCLWIPSSVGRILKRR